MEFSLVQESDSYETSYWMWCFLVSYILRQKRLIVSRCCLYRFVVANNEFNKNVCTDFVLMCQSFSANGQTQQSLVISVGFIH